MKQISFLAILLILICSLALIPAACSPAPADTTPAITPPVVAFASVEDGILEGESTTLFWIVTGADSVEIDQGIGSGLPTVGTVLITPASDTTYTLTAGNSIGSATQSVTITVTSPTPLRISTLAKITLKPMGDIDQNMLDVLKERLEQIFGCPVETEDQYYDLDAAYVPQRRQYLADTLLSQLRELGAAKGEKVLGVIEGDFYVPGDNPILGRAELGGQFGIISVSSLRGGQIGLISISGSGKANFSLLSRDALLLNRATKEAIHELGHTLGLEHCPDPKCVMYYSISPDDTDYKQAIYCISCTIRIER